MTTVSAEQSAPLVTSNMLADRLNEVTDWMMTNLQIVNKEGILVPLVPNMEQDRILTEIILQELSGLPGRIIILKARKVGCSTIIAAYGYYKCHENPHTRALVTAQDDEACITLFRISTRFHDYNPTKLPLRTPNAGKKELNWAPPNDSRYSVQTAGKISLGRTDTIHYLHCSEIPYWPHQKLTLDSVLNAVPDSSGIVVLESTANGYDLFKDRWDNAIKARSLDPNTLDGYTPLFFSWLEHSAYRKTVPAGYDWGELDQFERDLVDLGADEEQLYWRRGMVTDKCSGDPNTYMEEYPATPAQSFLASGRKKIPVSVLQHHRETSVAAGSGRKVRFSYDGNKMLVSEEGDWYDRYWELWELPDPACGYTIGGDVAEGLLSDPRDNKSKTDRTTGYILNRRTMRQAGRWQGPGISETDYGRKMIKAAQFFNYAWCSPEVNNTGKASVLVIAESGYEHLYRRQGPVDSLKHEQEKMFWGWKTTGGAGGTRAVMIADWIDICRPLPDFGFEGRMLIRSTRLAEEENTFIIKPNGKVEHDTGKHDDEIFAGMIAYQLHRLCPAYEITGYTAPPDGVPTIPTMAFTGGMDEYAAQMQRKIVDDENDEEQEQHETE